MIWWIIVVQAILSWLIAFNVINTSNDFVRSVWQARDDRYSEERGQTDRPKSEMSYLGG